MKTSPHTPWDSMMPLVPTKINTPRRLKANRAFMLRAVNNHQALVEALEGLLKAYHKFEDVRMRCARPSIETAEEKLFEADSVAEHVLKRANEETP